VYPRGGRERAAEFHFSIDPPGRASFGSMSLSPDGRQLAFTATADDGKTLLWVRPLDTTAARWLPDTDGATLPFWSPDSDALGFFAAGKLWTVDLARGSARAVCDAAEGRGGTWNRAGVIVFAAGPHGPLFRVPATGGSPAPVTRIDQPGERGHVWPAFLPDGNRFLYLADSSKAEHHNLFIGALESNERKQVLGLATSNAVYTREGYLVFAHERRLVAQPFDTTRLVLRGEPFTLVDEILQPYGLTHKTDFSVSDNGVLAYRSLGGFDTRLIWRDRGAQEFAVTKTPAEYFEPTLSPDEKRIAVDVFDHRPSKRFGFNVGGITSDIWIVDPSSGDLSQFTSDPGADFDPVWSPDGRSIVFSSNRTGVLDLYQKNADGTGNAHLLLGVPGAKHAQDWSPDGRFVVYATFDEKTRGDFWLLPMSGDRTPQPLLRTEFNEEQAQISPDGRWFAYTSEQSGRSEIYVQSFPEPRQQWQISTMGGGDPRWRADGKELFYIAEDRQLMAVAVNAGATFDHGAAVPLFDTGMRPHWGSGRNHYDVSRDGRFLLMTPVVDDRSSPFTVVLNWAAKLQK
ncbi:MAG: LpqB family beta-propeller domain-containing protein, partial [Vicinamibacterales bacterium]